MHNRMRCFSTLGLLGAIGLAATATSAPATPTYLAAFIARYPTSTLPARMQIQTGNQCFLCHHPQFTSNPGNCYKNALAARLNAGRTIEQALADVEPLDSDMDGTSNLAEITAVRTDLPGEVGYNPGLIGPTGTDPCGTSTTMAITNQLETPPLACYPNCDHSTTPPILNVNDFICFQSAFAAGDTYANCDHSTTPPVLNVNDFICFQSSFASGCP